MECPDIQTVPAMSPLAFTDITRNGTLRKNETAPPIIKIESRSVGGRVNYSCPQGFAVEGSPEAICQSNGQWSNDMPLCKGMMRDGHSKMMSGNSKMSMMMPMSSQLSNNGRNWNNNRHVYSRKRGGGGVGSSHEHHGGNSGSSANRGTNSLFPMRAARQ